MKHYITYITITLFFFLGACSSKHNKTHTKSTVIDTLTTKVVQIDDTLHHLHGTINGNIPLTMNIFIHKNSVNGSMYYDKSDEYIFLNGTIDKYGQMNLTGTLNNGKQTDIFKGHYNNKVYSGQWSSPSGSKTMVFNLKRTNDNWLLLDSFRIIIKDSVLFHTKDWITYTDSEVAIYPKLFPIPSAGRKIKQKINEILFNNAKDIAGYRDTMKQRLINWRNFLKDTIEINSPFPFISQYSINALVIYQKNLLLSFEIAFSSYSGGAHGSEGNGYYNFDLYTGNEIKIQQIFSAPMDTIRKHIIIPGLRKYCKNIYNQTLEQSVFNADSIGWPDEFYFTDTGIGFLYQEYSIAPYYLGTPNFEVSYKKLKPYLSNFILKRLGLNE